MVAKLTKKNIWYLIFFVIFGLIGSLMPYVGDDLNWQGPWGSQYFFSGDFLHYDGRYLGDLFVILLTRSKIFSFLLYGFCGIMILYLMKLISETIFPEINTELVILLTSSGLLLAPAFIFRQTWGWHAGFANYIPSVLFPLFFIYLVCRYYDQFRYQKFSRLIWIAVLVFSIISQFLAEHVTLLNCFNIMILWLFFRKHFSLGVKMQYFIPIIIGNFVGATLMFLNGAYWKIILGHDNYRKIGSTQGETLISFTKYVICNKKQTLFLIAFFVFFLFLMCLNYHKNRNHKQLIVDILVSEGCVISILPFIVISPFGPRCLFVDYIFILLAIVTNLVSLLNNYQKIILPICIIAALVIGVRFDYLAYHYGCAFELSKSYCLYQKRLNRKNNYVLNYSDNKYIWAPNASDDRVFKAYYIGKHQKAIPVEYDQWGNYYVTPTKKNIIKLDKIITQKMIDGKISNAFKKET